MDSRRDNLLDFFLDPIWRRDGKMWRLEGQIDEFWLILIGSCTQYFLRFSCQINRHVPATLVNWSVLIAIHVTRSQVVRKVIGLGFVESVERVEPAVLRQIAR